MNRSESAFDNALTKALEGLEISMGADEFARCRTHFELVVEANRSINLTRITEPAAAAVKHYADSLALLRWVEERRLDFGTVLDVGTGAGFPAVPLAIVRPQWTITAIDATAKKIRFVRSATETLGLTNLTCEHAHSRHWRPVRQFDLVVTRALTALPGALEQTAGHIVPGGTLVAYKTASIDPAEADAATDTAARLALHPGKRYTYDLSCEGETLKRELYIYRKAD